MKASLQRLLGGRDAEARKVERWVPNPSPEDGLVPSGTSPVISPPITPRWDASIACAEIACAESPSGIASEMINRARASICDIG